ncbi:CD225/dispanin family protein [Ereboglobus luteus]|uniref:GYF domain-containing protein n=1 Tax=Ereboglobus luteus TaxID=1796921 RepID=A0A2U8E217_9BACT|nr:CD225/dispanin family protein [Ereboglobus luteus]AWI08835.1 hypothetical protein CKA38_05830 [Ereboglobus luteus]
MTYHIARNNQQLGTFLKDEVIARYNAGAILPTDLVWTEGMATWEPASKIFGAPAAPAVGDVSVPGSPPPVTGVAEPMMTVPPDVKPVKPGNNLIGAIIVTLLCCVPLGIVSIVFAAQVDGKYNKGDYAGAEDAAKKSKTFMWLSVVLGLVASVIIFAMSFAGALAQ